MQFLISMTDIAGRWDALDAAEQERILKAHDAYRSALEAEGRFVHACHLHSREQARTVRMDDAGKVQTHAGPYSESAEMIGGFYIIEADSLDEATEWARRGRFMVGANEVRQIHTD
jgi:hypothetical protein